MQERGAGLPSSGHDGEYFGSVVVAPWVILGVCGFWAAAHIKPDTLLMVWKLDKDKNVLSVHAASVGHQSEDFKTD